MTPTIGEYINEFVERAREPLGLDGWQIVITLGPQPDGNKASCEAAPEYHRMVLSFDPEMLETGDELDEIIVHEMTHALTWEPFVLSEDYAKGLAKSAPKPMRKALRETLMEQARKAGEHATTITGFAFIRILRRLWAAEAEIRKLRADLRAQRKDPTTKA